MNEILARLPSNVTTAERMVVVVLAHRADEKTRECWPGMASLAADTGLHEDTVRKALTSLDRKGVPLRATSAARGHRTVYRIPILPQSPARSSGLSPAGSPDGTSSQSAESPDASPGKVGRIVRESPDGSSSPEGHEPRTNHPSTAREERAAMDGVDGSPDWAEIARRGRRSFERVANTARPAAAADESVAATALALAEQLEHNARRAAP